MWKNRKEMQENTYTISDDPEDSKVNLPFPVGSFLQGNAISCCGKDVATANSY